MKKNVFAFLLTLLGVGIIGLLWKWGWMVFPDKIPHISYVVDMLFSHEQDQLYILYKGLGATCINAFLGLSISIIVSFVIVVFVCLWSEFNNIVRPMAIFLKAVPIISLVPVLSIIFKTNDVGGYIASAFAISFFPMYVEGIVGIQQVPVQLNKLAKTYNANRWKQFWHFQRGYIIERMTSALQVSAPLSVVGAIVGEYVIARTQGTVFSLFKGYSLGTYISSNAGCVDCYKERFVGMVLCFFAGALFYFMGYIIHKWYENKTNINKQ